MQLGAPGDRGRADLGPVLALLLVFGVTTSSVWGWGKLEGQKEKERFEKIFNIPTDFIKESTVVG